MLRNESQERPHDSACEEEPAESGHGPSASPLENIGHGRAESEERKREGDGVIVSVRGFQVIISPEVCQGRETEDEGKCEKRYGDRKRYNVNGICENGRGDVDEAVSDFTDAQDANDGFEELWEKSSEDECRSKESPERPALPDIPVPHARERVATEGNCPQASSGKRDMWRGKGMDDRPPP